jgi:hypothetical protein
VTTVEDDIRALTKEDARELAHHLHEFTIQHLEGEGAAVLMRVADLALLRYRAGSLPAGVHNVEPAGSTPNFAA